MLLRWVILITFGEEYISVSLSVLLRNSPPATPGLLTRN